MTVSEAIKFLKKTVKYSCIPGQKHIDPGLLSAEQRRDFDLAMGTIHKAIYDQELTREEFEAQVGLAI